MKIREQITVTGDFPAAGCEEGMCVLADRIGDEAARRGLRICEDPEDGGTVWLRNHGTAGHPAYGECLPGEADTARVTLTAWAGPAGGDLP